MVSTLSVLIKFLGHLVYSQFVMYINISFHDADSWRCDCLCFAEVVYCIPLGCRTGLDQLWLTNPDAGRQAVMGRWPLSHSAWGLGLWAPTAFDFICCTFFNSFFSPSYINYSSICARVVRQVLKEPFKTNAAGRDDTLVKTAKWEAGKVVKTGMYWLLLFSSSCQRVNRQTLFSKGEDMQHRPK